MTIRNLLDEIHEAIPELKETKGNTKIISLENWNNRIKTLQTKIKNKYKRYSDLSTYGQYFKPCIIEYENTATGYGVVKIDETKYKMIRKYLLSDEHNSK